MDHLIGVCKVMLKLGVFGIIIGFIFMIGGIISKSPIWVGIVAAILTVTVGAVIGYFKKEV